VFRFASLSDSDLDQILEERDSKNTKSVIKLAVKVLNDYLIEMVKLQALMN
jgi:hypothetical protein